MTERERALEVERDQLRRELVEARAALAYWEHGVGPCRNCGFLESDVLGDSN